MAHTRGAAARRRGWAAAAAAATAAAQHGAGRAGGAARRGAGRGGGAGGAGAGPGRGGPGASERAASAASSREEREQQHGGAPTPAARLLLPHRRGRESPAGRLPGPSALLSPGRGSGTRSAWRRSAGFPIHPAPLLFLLGELLKSITRARGGTAKEAGKRLQFRAGTFCSLRRPLPRPPPPPPGSREVAGLRDRVADR